MQSDNIRKFSLSIMILTFIGFLYMIIKDIQIVQRTQIGTSDGIYSSYVTNAEEIKQKAYALTQECKTEFCKIQKLLDYVTNIPYKTYTFQKNTPQQTIQENFGDCDDKSNLLISMLHALGIEAYFVLVPKHIFVIVSLEDKKLSDIKGLWVNGKKYYILESTAKDSKIGFPLHYDLSEIAAIIEPFSNTKIKIDTIKYRL